MVSDFIHKFNMNCLRLLRPFTCQSLFKLNSVRLISQQSQRFLEIEDRYKEKDGLSRRWMLIYKAPMDTLLNYATTYLTFSTVAVTCASLYYAAFVLDPSNMNDPLIVGENVIIANDMTESLVYLGAFYLFHVATKVLLSKYVIRLYKDGDDYIAVFRGHWFNNIKKHKFHLDEFVKLNPTYVVTWGEARYGLGKKHGILLDHYFKTPEYLNRLLNKRKTNSEDDDS